MIQLEKPTLPPSVTGVEVKVGGKFRRVWTEIEVREFAQRTAAYERARILNLLDDFGKSCQEMAVAMANSGVGDPHRLSAQLDAVRLLQESICQPLEP